MNPIIQQILIVVNRTLAKSCLKKNQISQIRLAGGGSNTCFIRDILTDYFEGREITIDNKLNVDHIVSIGCCMFAWNRMRDGELSKQISIISRCGMKIGIKNRENEFMPFIYGGMFLLLLILLIFTFMPFF